MMGTPNLTIYGRPVRLMDVHPCFSCQLADCDEDHKGCNLRLVRRRYQSEIYRHRTPDPLLKLQYGIAWQELYAHTRDRRSGQNTDEEA
ncbi:hypothetical protein [Roseibium litorale]|uniref:Uncharacterized protein n=1 Tax=Roseibium litorale TaxID=2803841 RepID=A0ABR9CJB7_9HYPH|nr:hypothetical protein [Roseibium litorale]MBD8890925.1 hypothetical protein [Roseibium litorale]